MENRENLLGVIESLFRWKKPLIILCLLTAIGAVIVSLLLPNYYKSSTTYYVASPDLAMPEPVGSRLKERDLYGEDEDLDRSLTIAQSGELIGFMIEKYDLYEHYEINREGEKAPHKVRKRFLKLYNVQKTKYEAVELSIEDTDKALAADMVNSAREKVAEISRRLLKEGLGQQLSSYEATLKVKEQEIRILGDSLQDLRTKYGIYNALSQSEFISSLLTTSESKLAMNEAKLKSLRNAPNVSRDTINLVSAYVNGLQQEVKKNKETLVRFGEGMSTVVALNQEYKDGAEQFALDKERYKQLQAAYKAQPPVLYLVEAGAVPIVKSRPKRSILCVAAVLIAFLLGVAVVLILDMYRDVDWKEITNAR